MNFTKPFLIEKIVTKEVLQIIFKRKKTSRLPALNIFQVDLNHPESQTSRKISQQHSQAPVKEGDKEE